MAAVAPTPPTSPGVAGTFWRGVDAANGKVGPRNEISVTWQSAQTLQSLVHRTYHMTAIPASGDTYDWDLGSAGQPPFIFACAWEGDTATDIGVVAFFGTTLTFQAAAGMSGILHVWSSS